MTLAEKMEEISKNEQAKAMADEMLTNPNREMTFIEIITIVYETMSK
jgi:hypothetical protein